jgi:ectoine hydroxylase-related dioxygenase (phytanoyl-CoA dioxygenase family)
MTNVEYYVERFLRDGYVHIPGAISSDELAELRDAVETLVLNKDLLPEIVREDFKYGQLVGDRYADGDTLCRIEYSLGKHPAFVRVLGHPLILAFACHLFRRPFMVTWEDVIIKTPHDGVAVPPHQDLLYQSTNSLVFSVGVYLDGSAVSPLEVLPRTHRLGALARSQLVDIATARHREFVALPVQAGDFLIHNVLLIHRSPPNLSEAFRRTLYLELRTIDSVLGDSPWSAAWAWRRIHYVAAASAERGASPDRAREDLRFGDLGVNAMDACWRFAPVAPSPAMIDWRVHHDDIYRERAIDRETP